MNALQKSIDISVEELAAIIKKLSPEDRERLDVLTYEIPEWHKQIIRESIEKIRKEPTNLIPWKEAKEMLKKGR